MVLTDLHLIIEVNIHSALQPEVLHQCLFVFCFLSHMNKKTRCNATITQHRSSAEIRNKTLVITICLRCSALMPNYCCGL